jgi:hypothetical protein
VVEYVWDAQCTTGFRKMCSFSVANSR